MYCVNKLINKAILHAISVYEQFAVRTIRNWPDERFDLVRAIHYTYDRHFIVDKNILAQ
jgi:hypothetical protein